MTADAAEVIEHIDAAWVALPNKAHAHTALRLLEQGIHVCVEKPLACTAADCEQLIAASRANDCALNVGFDRRFRPQYRAARALIRSGKLGRIRRVVVQEGLKMVRAGDSGFYLDADQAGGGTLMDNGIHMLDQLLWWFGTPRHIRYADDSFGGLEAECELGLTFDDGLETELAFSRMRNLGSTARVEGDLGSVDLSYNATQIRLTDSEGVTSTQETSDQSELKANMIGAIGLWEDFAATIQGRQASEADANAGLETIRLIEQCYRERTPLARPWNHSKTHLRASSGPAAETTSHNQENPVSPFIGRTVLVTGGSGFIGGRVVEKLRFDHQARVRVLTRDPARALRALSAGASLIKGDMQDHESLQKATAGCDFIVHCARDDGPRQGKVERTMKSTGSLIDLALANEVEGLVNVSSMVVYGQPETKTLDESAPINPGSGAYNVMKAGADKLFKKAFDAQGLSAVTLQPGIVYGPFGQTWTGQVLKQLKHQRLVLSENDPGVCNLVHVDDVADAILLAAANRQAQGQSFLISGAEPASWNAFYRALAGMIDRDDALVYLPMETITNRLQSEKHRHRLHHRLLGLVTRVLGGGNDPRDDCEWPGWGMINTWQYPASINIAKARKLLGYEPRVSFEEGMRRTQKWADYYRLS